MEIRTKAYIYLVASLLTGAILPVVFTFAKSVNIFQFLMLTYLFSIPSALILVRLTHSSEKLRSYLMDGKTLLIILVIALLTYVSIQFVILFSEHYIDASLTTVVFRTSPILMLMFLPAVLKEKLSKSQIVALILGFLGIYISLTHGTFVLSVAQSDLPIIALLALAALAYALGSILPKRFILNMSSQVLLFNVFMFLLFAFLFAVTGFQTSPLSLGLILLIIYISLVNNVVGIYMYFSAMRMLKTTIVTNFFFLSPFVTFALASVFLGEVIQPYYLAVAALVAVGILIQRYDKTGGTYVSKNGVFKNLMIRNVSGIFAETKDKAISDAIERGDFVLSTKIDRSNEKLVDEIVSKGHYRNVFTEQDKAIKCELSSLRKILRTEDNEIVIVKTGNFDENEDFLASLSSKLAVS